MVVKTMVSVQAAEVAMSKGGPVSRPRQALLSVVVRKSLVFAQAEERRRKERYFPMCGTKLCKKTFVMRAAPTVLYHPAVKSE